MKLAFHLLIGFLCLGLLSSGLFFLASTWTDFMGRDWVPASVGVGVGLMCILLAGLLFYIVLL